MAACMIEQPAMQLWQANGTTGGTLGLAVVNFAVAPVDFNVSIDVSSLFTELGDDIGQTVRARVRGVGGDGAWHELAVDVGEGRAALHNRLAPLTTAMIEVARA